MYTKRSYGILCDTLKFYEQSLLPTVFNEISKQSPYMINENMKTCQKMSQNILGHKYVTKYFRGNIVKDTNQDAV